MSSTGDPWSSIPGRETNVISFVCINLNLYTWWCFQSESYFSLSSTGRHSLRHFWFGSSGATAGFGKQEQDSRGFGLLWPASGARHPNAFIDTLFTPFESAQNLLSSLPHKTTLSWVNNETSSVIVTATQKMAANFSLLKKNFQLRCTGQWRVLEKPSMLGCSSGSSIDATKLSTRRKMTENISSACWTLLASKFSTFVFPYFGDLFPGVKQQRLSLALQSQKFSWKIKH